MTVPILIATLRGADYMNFDMGKVYMMITVAIVPIIVVYLLLIKIYHRRRDTWWSERVNTIWTENHMEENSVWFFLSF